MNSDSPGIFRIVQSEAKRIDKEELHVFDELKELIFTPTLSYKDRFLNGFKKTLQTVVPSILLSDSPNFNFLICLYFSKLVDPQLVPELETKLGAENFKDLAEFYRETTSINFSKIINVCNNYITKSKWKNRLILMDSLILMVKNLNQETIHENIHQIIVYILFLLDDWEDPYRTKGLDFLYFVLQNASADSIKVNNMHLVLFDVLKKFINPFITLEMINLYLETIFVFQEKFEPQNEESIEIRRVFHEEFFEVILPVVEYLHPIGVTVLSNLPRFIEALGFNMAKLSQQLLNVLKSKSRSFVNPSKRNLKLVEAIFLCLNCFMKSLPGRIEANAKLIFAVVCPLSRMIKRFNEPAKTQYEICVDMLMNAVPERTKEFMAIVDYFK